MKKVADLRTVRRRARSVLVRNKRQLRIHVDERPHMNGAVDRSQNILHRVKLRGIRLDRFHAWRDLQRIG